MASVVTADPYDWPYDGVIDPRKTAFMVIDMQTDEGNYQAALKMITMQGGVFGAVATSEALIKGLSPLIAH